ncbi:MAG TPA: PEGA domain-containing protein [Trueperaceae bacterium]|nr:PEGA domain-containing protein [Trueperaceae bacterium]
MAGSAQRGVAVAGAGPSSRADGADRDGRRRLCAPPPALLAALLALLLAAAPAAAAQISVPTFGTRGGVPAEVVSGFMPVLRQAVAAATGLKVTSGELVTPGIAGSLEPEFARLIAELDNARYAVSGEIARNAAAGGEPYTVNLIVVDAGSKRNTDLISRPLQPDAMADTARALAAAVAAFTGAAESLPKGNAGLFVSSEPGHAEVSLDGVSVGRTSDLDVLMLKPGRYDLEVRKEGFLPESRSVDVRADDTSFVHVILTAISGGSVQLSATPPARVYLDGAREGRTPLTLPALPGSHTVKLLRDGFLPESFSVLVRNYRVTRVAVSLHPIGDPLVFWAEDRTDLVLVDGVLQKGGYADGLTPGLHTFELKGPAGDRTFMRAVPDHGLYRLDLKTGELVPASP